MRRPPACGAKGPRGCIKEGPRGNSRKSIAGSMRQRQRKQPKFTRVQKMQKPIILTWSRKCISPCGGIRQIGSQLFVPVYVEDKLTSLQFIEEDGTKRFLSGGEIKGGCCILGAPAEVICIAEGYATGCSIHEATGHAVAVAFNAGNLMHVAQAMRQRYKQATLILCADNDQWTEGNPGLTKAMEAATAVDALLAVPDFSGCDMSSRPTDFNDLHVLAGKEAVSQAIAAAGKVDVGGLSPIRGQSSIPGLTRSSDQPEAGSRQMMRTITSNRRPIPHLQPSR